MIIPFSNQATNSHQVSASPHCTSTTSAGCTKPATTSSQLYCRVLLALLAQRWLLPTSTASAHIVGFIAYLLAVGSKMSTIHITGGCTL